MKEPSGCGPSMKRTKLARSREDTCAKPTHENSTDASGVNGLYAAQASAVSAKATARQSPMAEPEGVCHPVETLSSKMLARLKRKEGTERDYIRSLG